MEHLKRVEEFLSRVMNKEINKEINKAKSGI